MSLGRLLRREGAGTAAVLALLFVVATPVPGSATAEPPPAAAERHPGDANDDGFDDLAVGSPFDEELGVNSAGQSTVFDGSATGPVLVGSEWFTNAFPGIPGDVTFNGYFASSLSWGDFDGDHFDDLAIGMTGYGNGGGVIVVPGSATGLDGARSRLYTPGRKGISDPDPAEGAFGGSVAAGNLGRGPQDDLAIGDENETIQGQGFSGRVTVIYGSARGLRPRTSQTWSRGTRHIKGSPGSSVFGSALAIGNFGFGRTKDLAIGARLADPVLSGSVNVLYGTRRGLASLHNQLLSKANDSGADDPAFDDGFGSALAVGKLDGDAYADLVIGAPGDGWEADGAGRIWVWFGDGDAGLSANRAVGQATVGIPDIAEVGDSFGRAVAAGDLDGDGRDEIVVGAPYENTALDNAGKITVFPIDRANPIAGAFTMTQDFPGIPGGEEAGDAFGSSLAAGNYGYSVAEDLAVGAAGENIGPTSCGAVWMIYGTIDGLSSAGSSYLDQDQLGVADVCEDGDNWGTALA